MRGSGTVGTGDLTPRIAGSAVDPRFRARRIAVRKDAGRRRLKRLLVLVAVAATALTAVIVLRSPVLDVDEVTVAGHGRTDPAQIRAAAGIDAGEPLLLVDLAAAERSVEALPWVAEADIVRDLPSHVHVTVRERTPAAVVAGGGRAVLVDLDGHVLDELGDEPGAPFVQVLAPGAPPAIGAVVDRDLTTAIGLAGRLRANPVGAVAAVHVEPRLRLELVDGAMVDLGDTSDLDAKVEAFRTVHARVDRECLARIDLTVPTHPVLTRRPC